MTGPLIAYGLVVGVLVAATARALEGIFTLGRRPVRWIWGVALGLMIVLIAFAPFRDTRPGFLPLAPVPAITQTGEGVAAAEDGLVRGLFSAVNVRCQEIGIAVEYLIAGASRSVPGSVERWLPLGWVTLSGILFLGFGLVYVRVFRLRRRWPLSVIQGVPVRVARDVGPAVVGFARSEIVVPQWLLDRSPAEQRLVLAHELEHVRARDPLVLAGACIAVAILPWNPAVWWMLSRLRLAVELDCDARVLRQGVAPRSYGELLIELAGVRSEIRAGVAALAGRSSHLEQRLLAMKSARTRLASARAAALASFGALALASLIVACEARLPTGTEVETMNVARAEKEAQIIPLLALGKSESVYSVDGMRVTPAEARAVKANEIAAIEIVRATVPGAKSEIRVTTVAASSSDGAVSAALATKAASITRATKTALVRGGTETAATLATSSRPDPARWVPFVRPALTVTTVPVPIKPGGEMTALAVTNPAAAMVLVDGVRASPGDLKALATADIESIEIVRGAAARKLYGFEEAANGVISVTTKKGGTSK